MGKKKKQINIPQKEDSSKKSNNGNNLLVHSDFDKLDSGAWWPRYHTLSLATTHCALSNLSNPGFDFQYY